MGIPKDSPAGRRRFGEVREQRQEEELPEAEWKAIERGWRRGEEGFRAELLAQVRELRAEHYGEEVRQAEEERALAIVKKEPEARGWKEKRRIERREGDPEKLKIAVHLRRKTTMTLRLIARKLPMGSWTYLSNLPGQERTGKKNKSV